MTSKGHSVLNIVVLRSLALILGLMQHFSTFHASGSPWLIASEDLIKEILVDISTFNKHA
jgi:hypothetical protein